MALQQADRIIFSLQIVSAAAQLAGLNKAQAQSQASINALQNLDTANKNLFDPVNVLVANYAAEFSALDGNNRTTISEQDIQDAGNKTLQNHFFPNDTTVSVPSLSAAHNVWTKPPPYALTYAIGKNYSEAYPSTPSEQDKISAITTLISSTSTYTDLELTTGNSLGGSCSNPTYTDAVSCVAHGGTWTPSFGPDPTIHAIATNMTAAVNSLISFLNTEATYIVTTDATSPNQSQNAAALNNINNVIIPALNTWLAYPDFAGAGGPSKLHSTQLTALSSALSARTSFIATRISQLNTVLGTVVQDVSTGDITSSSGLYGKRYNYLSLRLNILTGSLSQLLGFQKSVAAQNTIKSSITGTALLYQSFIPTTALAANGSGTNIVNVASATAYAPGDTVYVMADNQQELLRAIRSISGNLITLNDIVPSKYTTNTNARLYKDLS